MRPATAAVIKALDGKRMTARQLAGTVHYGIRAVEYALAFLEYTDQAEVVDQDARIPAYQLTGDVCPCCGQVMR